MSISCSQQPDNTFILIAVVQANRVAEIAGSLGLVSVSALEDNRRQNDGPMLFECVR